MSVDLTTEYLGLKLTSPIVVSSCPITGDPDGLRRLEGAGAGAAVLPSLFEEQVEGEQLEVHRLYDHQSDVHAESLSFLPELQDYNTGPKSYLLLDIPKRPLPIECGNIDILFIAAAAEINYESRGNRQLKK